MAAPLSLLGYITYSGLTTKDAFCWDFHLACLFAAMIVIPEFGNSLPEGSLFSLSSRPLLPNVSPIPHALRRRGIQPISSWGIYQDCNVQEGFYCGKAEKIHFQKYDVSVPCNKREKIDNLFILCYFTIKAWSHFISKCNWVWYFTKSLGDPASCLAAILQKEDNFLGQCVSLLFYGPNGGS